MHVELKTTIIASMGQAYLTESLEEEHFATEAQMLELGLPKRACSVWPECS